MIRFFAGHPTAGNLLMLMFIVVGMSTLPTLKRETFPEFAPQEIQVMVVYPGASAEDVETAVCLRLEDAIEGVADLAELRCQALENKAIAVAEMSESGDISQFMDDIKSEVDAISDFPEQTEQAVIEQLGKNDQVTSVAITGPMDVKSLKAYAEEIKERMRSNSIISQVTIQGFSQHQLRIKVSMQALRQHDLSISDLANSISRQSIDLPIGNIETSDREILVRFTDQRRTIQDLENLIVLSSKANIAEIRLRDIAKIEDQFELDEEKITFNGQRAALLSITKTKEQDTLVVFEAVDNFIKLEQQRAPPGVKLTITQNMSTIVKDRLKLLLVNGIQGLILVFLVMWLFFRFTFAFWVSMGLPISFLGGLFLMSLLGQSINMISMVALLIALGLLMDDAIVISENIASHLRKGKKALDAAIDGTLQVMPGVVSSFLTTTAIFLPLAFLSGDMGKVLLVIPIVLIAVLAVSLIEAFFILPHHLEHSLKNHEIAVEGSFRHKFDGFIERLRHDVLGKSIDLVIQWRYAFLGLVISAFTISVGMVASGHLKVEAFPSIEGNAFEARLLMPQGTPLWRTEEVVDQLTTALQRVNQEYTAKQPNQQTLIKSVTVSFNKNLDAFENGSHVATIAADLLSAEKRVGRIDDIIQRWREEAGPIPGIIHLNFKEPTVGPAGLAVNIRLNGSDLQELKSASSELQNWLKRYNGLLNLSDDLRPGKPEFQLALKEGSFSLGINAQIVASQLRASFYGTTAYEMQVGKESYEIDVRLADADKDSIDELMNFRIITATGAQIPLSTIAEIKQTRGYARINRINGRRTITITADVNTELANAQQIIKDTTENYFPELKKKFPTISIEQQGQSAESNKTGSSMLRGFIIGLVGIFILLSFQFRSYLEPFVVMVTIPMAFIGVVWGHLLMGLEISMPSMMGAASLAGIVVNDSILLVEFLKLRARQGHNILEAAKLASRERFRAILLTSLTTIAGLTPLLLEKSLQAQILTPLATSIVFGLLTSTVLVLLVVPAIFSVFSDFGWVSVKKEIASEKTTS